MAFNAPWRSVTSAVVTAIAWGKPCVSTSYDVWYLRLSCLHHSLCVQHNRYSLHFGHQRCKSSFWRCILVWYAPRQPDFLMPVPAGCLCLLASRSTAKNNDVPSAISENDSVASAIGNRFSVSTAPRKTHRTNQLGADASSCVYFSIVHESVQTVLD